MINAFKKDKSKIIGQRELNFKNTPLRNYIEIKLPHLFLIIVEKINFRYSMWLKAIPYSRFSKCLKFKENKYAYETKFC